MLPHLAPLLILAGLGLTASDAREALPRAERHVDAVEVFSCDFGEGWDVNYDRWPDKWQRKTGPGWPLYVPIELTQPESPAGARHLVIGLNGGSAQISSPAISVSESFSYVVQARVRATGVQHSRVQVRIDFCDESRQVLQSHSTDWFKNTQGWTDLHIGPISISTPGVRLAMVTLQVERGDHVDLTGQVALDDVWLARLPRMTVSTNSSFNVYTDWKDVEVTCDLSGILEKDPDIHFQLLDASSDAIHDQSVQLDGRLINERVSKASDIVSSAESRVDGFAGSTRWHPPIKDYGFYRVRVSMRTQRGTPEERLISLAIVPPLADKPRGEFGWSLAGDDLPLTFAQLEELLPRVAVNWVKLPVWYGETESERGEQLVLLSERLAAKDIEIVGVIDQPPADIELGKRVTKDATIADLLTSEDPSAWLPSLDAVLTRLSLRVRWWQLGVDRDTSFSAFPDLETEVGDIRKQLFRFGQDVKLGIGWPWHQQGSSHTPATWDFQQMSATPALTGAEIAAYLDVPRREGVMRWALVQPLDRDDYDLETRTRDLVEQLLAAKIHGADGIFVSTPFDDQRGLMADDGTPGELLLPWRTTTSLLSGARYQGHIRLPSHSENQIFQTVDGEFVMVIWNQSPVEETLYLGDRIRVIDVWGRSTTPKTSEGKHVVGLNSLPRFVVGLDPLVTKWRMAAKLSETQIPSVMGEEHPNRLEITNTFKQGVGGHVQLHAPTEWQVFQRKLTFKLGAGEHTRRPFEVVLPFDANSGVATLRAEFDFSADRPYHFNVFRDVQVGDQDIELELHTRLNEDGKLVVEQRMINHAAEFADFKCLLYAEDRRTQKLHVFRLGNSQDLQTYLYPNGKELLGTKLWLRAEELEGTRILNHRIVVEQ